MYRIRVKKAPGPVMQRGGGVMGDQRGFGLQVPGAMSGNYSGGGDMDDVRSHLPEVDRGQANIEAERGETVMGDFDSDGLNEHYKIAGKPHSKGGTPLSVPDGSFVFSNTRRLKIGGPILQEFGKNGKGKKKYSFADLAKQYNVNRYQGILQHDDSDKLDLDTAQLMLNNYQQKLGKLALLQEGIKGFPQGIPAIAAALLGRQGNGLLQQPGAPAPPTPPTPMPTAPSAPLPDAPSPDMPPPDAPVRAQYGRTVFDTNSRDSLYHKMYPMFYNQSPALPDYDAQGMPDNSGIYADNRNAALNLLRPGALDLQTDANTRSLYGDQSFIPVANGKTVYPQYIKGNTAVQVPLIQHKRADGTYGTQAWDMNDFYQRHPWIKQQRPGFDPKNPSDVKWFQNEYNSRYNNIWGNNYFDGEGHRKIDSRFGQGTYSTPSVIEGPPTPPPGKEVKKDVPVKKDDGVHTDQNPLQWQVPPQQRMPWWSQDMINNAAAIAGRYDLQKYMPTYVGMNAYLPDPTFFDPTRQLAANQESAAQQGVMNAFYGNASSARSNGSNVQGQSAANAANILGQGNNQNVSIANQAADIRAQILNNQSLRNSMARKSYMDELATVNQQFDNSKRLGNENMRANLVSGISNAQRTNWLNRMNSQFQIDPTSGRIFFTKGRELGDRASGSTPDPYTAYSNAYQQLMTLPGVSGHPEWAHAFAMKKAFGSSPEQDGVSPEALAMLRAYSG